MQLKGLVQIPYICHQQEVEKIAFKVVAIITKKLILTIVFNEKFIEVSTDIAKKI